MARQAPGQVVERKSGMVAIRFRAYGQRHCLTLGHRSEGWDRRRALDELANVLADVRRGIWRPPEPEREPEPPAVEPTFHQFASRWLEGRIADGLSERSIEDLRWSLEVHLLPHFAHIRLAEIGVEQVDTYRRAKVREGRLSASSINKTLKHLSAVLEEAREYGHLATNPATGKRRRLKAPKARRVHLAGAEWIGALLDAAGELDAKARTNHDRRALLSTCLFAGLRISEALALRWRDVDLAAGRLRMRASKTDAGVRYVPLLPALRDELLAHKARAGTEPPELVFTTRDGHARDRNAARTRCLHPAVEVANERLEEAGVTPLPEGLTLHGLRHSYVSLRLAVGHDIATVAQDAGHADPVITASTYTHVMRLDEGERERLRALVDGVEWAPAGTEGSQVASAGSDDEPTFGSTMRVRGVAQPG
jgi:integrase